jgi:hypothetical protein
MEQAEASPAPNPITWEHDPEPEPAAPDDRPEAKVDAVEEEKKPAPLPSLPETTTGGAPYWAIVPQGLVVPKGRAVFFARFPSTWTDTPNEGIEGPITDEDAAGFVASGVAVPKLWRQTCFWALSIGDQKIALGRANGDFNRFNTELTKQMIRATDGLLVDRSGAQFDLWWERLGERCRSELTRMCVRIHSLTAAERSVFFAFCVASRAAG